MEIYTYWENRERKQVFDLPAEACADMVERDYQQRQAAAEDRAAVIRRDPQTILEEEVNKPGWNKNHRETRRHQSLEASDPYGKVFRSDMDVEELFCGEYAALHEALCHLTAGQQELVRRIYWNGEKAVDIAREQGVSKSAISHRLELIHARLRKLLSDEKNF